MASSTTLPAAKPAQRLMSLDALRGFDMFWILGGDALGAALEHMNKNPATQFFARQLDHAEWAGFRFYDLIFPLFVFMMGVSTVFSLEKIIARDGRPAAIKRVLIRGILLLALGLVYSGGFTNPWPDMRLMGVLNRIALCYTFGGLAYVFLRTRGLVIVATALLLGYWAMMALVPIRDIHLEKNALAAQAEAAGDIKLAAQFRAVESYSARNPSAIKDSPVWAATVKMFQATTNQVTGQYDPGYNLANQFDFEYLPARKYDLFYDPEGLLSTLPALVTGLFGIFTGRLLRYQSMPELKKVLWLAGAGAVSVTLGWLWGMEFPVVKKIWTSSYVLVAGGYSALLLALFYWLVDVRGWQRWCQPFVWIGMNPITLYLASNFMGGLGFGKLANRLVGGPVKEFLNSHGTPGCGELVVACTGILLFVWFAHFLYRRKIFLRV
jgi:predicted acyltransferase